MALNTFTSNTKIESAKVNANFTGLADGTEINNDAITTDKIIDAAVTPSKLALGGQTNTVSASESTTSTSATDLATSQAVTATIGANGAALVSISASINSSTTAQAARAHFAVSGATTVAADDNNAIETQGIFATAARTYLVTGLTAGSNTFTMKFWVSGGTGTFRRRNITVIPL